MSDFVLRVTMPDYSFNISHKDHVMCLGSCFAEHIYRYLSDYKFSTLLNPFGILYNPVIIGEGLDRLRTEKSLEDDALVYHQELWHSFSHHGHFSHPEKEKAIAGMQLQLEKASTFLKKTTRLIITLGAAYVYVLKETGKVVANCHKFPASKFDRKLLSVEQIVEPLINSFAALKQVNPSLEIILAVSPIRHIRDGLIDNQKSKAALILATAKICTQLPFVHYFPSYEIVLDELRDYRFFERDMIHPNVQAIQYIREKFASVFFDKNTQQLNNKIDKVLTAAKHRPFHPQTKAHQDFLKYQLQKVKDLEKQFSFLHFEREIATFKEGLED